MPAARRDVAPWIQRLRAFLLGREHTLAVRFEDGLANRTQPPPTIPGGAAHKLAANYYCNRDVRRAVMPPTVLTETKLLQGDVKAVAPSGSTGSKLPTPGAVFRWD